MSTSTNITAQDIESIPPDLLSTMPSGPPPPGVQPNFVDPPSRAPIVLGVSSAALALACPCFFLRIYTKLAIAKRWTWDDLTCSLGFAISILCYGEIVTGCIKGVTGRHVWDIPLAKVVDKTNLMHDYLTTVLVVAGLGLIKLSLFIQYYLLFSPLRYVRISVYIGATILVISYVSLTITALALESPWPGQSWLSDALSRHYLKFELTSIPCGVVGLLFDCYLLVLPMPVIWNLNMSCAKKFGVMLVFMTGSLAVVASVQSLHYRILFQDEFVDLPWNVAQVFLCSLIEMFTGVAASSMPAVRQFFHHHNLSLMSSAPCSRANLPHLRTSSMRSTRKKVQDDDSSFKDLIKSKRRGSEITDGFKMRDLDTISDEHRGPAVIQNADAYIKVQQDVTVTTAQIENPSSRPVAASRHLRWDNQGKTRM